MSKIKNYEELADHLLDNFIKLKEGKMSIPLAKEMSNSAGKTISNYKGKMDYNKMTGQKDQKISFFES